MHSIAHALPFHIILFNPFFIFPKLLYTDAKITKYGEISKKTYDHFFANNISLFYVKLLHC